MSTPKQGTIVITGVPRDRPLAPGEAPPQRREIHDLVKDKRQFSLYAQAVAELQKLKQADFLSWYAIGGIHGKPNIPWDGAPNKNPNWFGYCTHGIVLFPTWHRPYVALFEQALQSEAVKIASKYQVDQAEWNKAAQNLRAPYWDWAFIPTSLPPKETYEYTNLEIIGFDGKPTTIPNPFLAFKFDPPLHYPGPNDNHRVTYRLPGLVQRLQDIQSELPDAVYKMLTLIKNWYDFSNHTPRRGTSPVANSLESIHDTMHVEIGGIPPRRTQQSGDMTNPNIAAFDPFFWLHHANVDRLLSLWQAINPDVWVNTRDDPRYGPNTDLIPFWNKLNPSSFHQSSSSPVRVWTDFNYTYPEFATLQSSSPAARRQAILGKVKELYGSDATRGGPDAEDYVEWYARVWSKTYALGGSYTIYVFFGTPPESPSEWTKENNLVGRHAIFANPHPEECSNCNEELDQLHEGIVVLTTAVEEKLGVGKPEQEIEEYLKNNLAYRVIKADGTVVPTSEVPGFRAAIETIKLSYSQDDGIYQKPEGTEPVNRGIFEGGENASGSS